MKKIILALIAVFAVLMISDNANAQKKTKIADGLYLVSYGNTCVIEDDNNQQSLRLKVDMRKDGSGRPIYDLLCGNKYTKGIAKTALQGAITYGLASAGAAMGGASGAAFGAYLSKYANSIASNFYDDVCDYYKDR